MLMGIFYLQLTSESLREFGDCPFAFSRVASWWAVCSFCFWYRLKGNSSWNNLIRSSYFLSFFFLSFFLANALAQLALIASLMMSKLLSGSYSSCPVNCFKKQVSFWTEEQSHTHTSDMMPLFERRDGHIWFSFFVQLPAFVWTSCARFGALYSWVLFSLSIEMLLQTYNGPEPFSFYWCF